MTESFSGGGSAASLLMRAADAVASAVVGVARQLLTDLERGHRIDAAVLRRTMEAAFGASDAAGAWDWKAADLHHRHRHRKRPRSSHLRHMKPGLRGRYPVQSPKSRVDINSIGKVMRIPCSTAVLRAASLAPGRKADTCGEPISTARANAVLNAEPSASGRATASGPMWPPALT
jgi:hypothetical protein